MKYITLLSIPLLATSASALSIIDSFDNTGLGDPAFFDITQTGTTNGNDGPNTTVASQIGLSSTNVIGGARETRAHNTFGSRNNEITNEFGEFAWEQGAFTTGHFHLNYGSNGGFADLDANFSADTGVALSILFSDSPGTIKVTFNMNDGEATAAVWSGILDVPEDVANGGPAGPYESTVLFSDFVNESGGAFDITDVDGITIETGSNLTATDWIFDYVATASLPEPSSTAFLALGGLALVMRRRRD